MIDKSFTLVYHFTERDLRTQAVRDKEAELYRRDAQREVDADRMSPEELEKAVDRMRKERHSYERDVTLSFDGRTLYVECNQEVFLVQSSRNFYFPQQGPSWTPSVSDWYNLYIIPVPTVGPSLPFIPVAINGQTVVMDSAPRRGGKPFRNPGWVEGKSGKVTRLVQFAPGRPKPYGITTFSDHRVLNGFAVASSIFYRERMPDGQPTKTREFRLTSASEQPLPPSRFSPDSYLLKKCNFMVYRNGSGRTFDYDPAKGALEGQLQGFLSGGSKP